MCGAVAIENTIVFVRLESSLVTVRHEKYESWDSEQKFKKKTPHKNK